MAGTPSWRPEALRLLAARGFTGAVFVPEPRDGAWTRDYDGQIEWEEAHLHMADVVLFWLPRELGSMPGLTTNDEWGAHKYSGKVVFGAPPGAAKVRYQQYYAGRLHIPGGDSLAATGFGALLEKKLDARPRARPGWRGPTSMTGRRRRRSRSRRVSRTSWW